MSSPAVDAIQMTSTDQLQSGIIETKGKNPLLRLCCINKTAARSTTIKKIVLVSLLFYWVLFEEGFSPYFSRIKSLNSSIRSRASCGKSQDSFSIDGILGLA